MRRRRGGAVLALAAVIGCADGAPTREDGAEPAAAGEATAAALVPNTPRGGLDDWVADVREGLTDLPARAGEAPADLQQQALDLYISRQEYIEMYYGVGGRLDPPEPLIQAVDASEERFHELMRLLGSEPAPDRAALERAVARLEAQHRKVLEEVRRAGLPLDPRAELGGER